MINTVTLLGRLVADPELRHTSNDTAVTNFTLAVDAGWGEHKRTDFIDCAAWRSTAEFICQYFAKGRKIAVTGSLQAESYEDRQGNKRKKVEVNVKEADFADSKDAGVRQSAGPGVSVPGRPAAFAEPDEGYGQEVSGEDDLPF